jgi:hypothetical protein
VALAGLFSAGKAGLYRVLLVTAVVLSLASFGAMAQTAHLGGLIRHTELGQPGQSGDGSTSQESEAEEENQAPQTKPLNQPAGDSLAAPQPQLRKKDDDD